MARVGSSPWQDARVRMVSMLLVLLLVLVLAACGGPSGAPVTRSPGSTAAQVDPRLRPCVDAVTGWQAQAGPSPIDANELLGVFSRCQTVEDLEAVVASMGLAGMGDVRAWVDEQCRRFRLERELGQTPLCRDVRAVR